MRPSSNAHPRGPGSWHSGRGGRPLGSGRNAMRSMRMFLATAVATTALVLPSTPASAEERTCRGTLGAITVDNLRVPSGASCTLQGTTVQGTVKVESRATLVASAIRVIGNVQAENAARVVVRDGSSVGGSQQVVQGGAARVVGSSVNGDILVEIGRASCRERV